MDYQKNARVFKALCDENRWKILDFLKNGEQCGCVLLNKLDISQSTLSHHMKILCDSGIVEGKKAGKWTHYSISQQGVAAAQELLAGLTINDLTDRQGCSCRTSSGGICVQGKTKLYVLTGFLGSGKTTILLRLLDQLKGRRVGVIQNEFGKLGIDGTILRDDDIKMVEISRGSIFCSCLKLSFVQALADMAAQDLEYLFVESSGLGDPSNVEEILDAAKQLCGDAYDFAGAICLVDAVNFFDQLDDLETVHRQLKHCHLAVITKVDLVDAERLSQLREKIRQINPACRIEVSANANLDLSFMQEDLMQYSWAQGEETTNVPEAKPKSIFMNCNSRVPAEKLETFLLQMADDLYRAKGFVDLEEQGWSQVDLVGHRVDIKPCEPQPQSQLVFISKIGPQVIRKLAEIDRSGLRRQPAKTAPVRQ